MYNKKMTAVQTGLKDQIDHTVSQYLDQRSNLLVREKVESSMVRMFHKQEEILIQSRQALDFQPEFDDIIWTDDEFKTCLDWMHSKPFIDKGRLERYQRELLHQKYAM